MKLAKTAALLLAVIAMPAAAQTKDEKAKAAVDPNKKVCRTVDTTGSIMMGTRVCHTKSEWAAIDGKNNDTASDMRDPRGRYGGGGTRLGGSN